jgi:hypothetical protein
MAGLTSTERPERSEAENSRWVESAKDIALLIVMAALIWVALTVLWPATFGSLSSEFEFAAFLLLVSSALILACAGGLRQAEAPPKIRVMPVARETLVSVSLPEMSVLRVDPPVPAGQATAPHTTAPISEPVLSLPER